MAVTVTQNLEANMDQYDQINEKLNAAGNPPDGLIIHTAAEVGGRMRVVDVWESQAAFDKFVEERIRPVVAEVMGEGGGSPDIEITELHNVVAP
jgi:quinol monooxygenase YgiN